MTEAAKEDANKILDELNLPNYDDVEMRLAQPEMTATKQRNHPDFVIKDAETRRRQAVAMKLNVTKDFKAKIINSEVRDLKHKKSHELQAEIKEYMKHYRSKLETMEKKGSGRKQRGRGTYIFNDAKEMLQNLTLIIAEMEAGNTSIKMRNMDKVS